MRVPTAAAVAALTLLGASGGPAAACTTFCFDGPQGPIFGCNLDLFIPGDGLVFINPRGVAKEGFGPGTTGVTAKWASQYGSVTFNVAGREFAVGGMNEAGLVVGSMQLLAAEFPEPDERGPLTIGTWAQYALDTCGSVEEVVHTDATVRIEDAAPPVHFLVADAEGNCAAIEWLDGELVCHTGDALPVRAMTNMPYARALAAYERGGPHWWWSNPGRSAERFATAGKRNRSYDASRHPDPMSYAFTTLVELVSAPHTKWSIVYDVAKREIWYGSVRSPAGKHVSLRSDPTPDPRLSPDRAGLAGPDRLRRGLQQHAGQLRGLELLHDSQRGPARQRRLRAGSVPGRVRPGSGDLDHRPRVGLLQGRPPLRLRLERGLPGRVPDSRGLPGGRRLPR